MAQERPRMLREKRQSSDLCCWPRDVAAAVCLLPSPPRHVDAEGCQRDHINSLCKAHCSIIGTPSPAARAGAIDSASTADVSEAFAVPCSAVLLGTTPRYLLARWTALSNGGRQRMKPGRRSLTISTVPSWQPARHQPWQLSLGADEAPSTEAAQCEFVFARAGVTAPE